MERGDQTQPSDERIARLEQRVAELEQALRPPPPVPTPAPITPTAQRAPVSTSPPQRPPARQFDFESLLTTRTLAWAGGGVLLIGLAFFLAIAVDRGWINEPARVVLGALLSGSLLGFAAILRSRYGRVEAGLVAAGAGIAGLLGSDLAAGPLYGLLPDPVTIFAAVVIAGLAVNLAVAWSEEKVAAVGLIGAMLAAPVILSDIRLSGLCVVAILLGTAAVLLNVCKWRLLMLASISASLPQALYWIAVNGDLHAQALALIAGFWLLTMAPLMLYELLGAEDRLDAGAASGMLAATSYAVSALLVAVSGSTLGLDRGGLVVGGLGLVYLSGTALLWLQSGSAANRDLRSLLGGAGLAVVALAFFIIFKHHALVISLGVEATLLAWLGRQLDEERLNFAAAAYLGAALVYLAGVEAQPKLLFDSTQSPGIEMVGVAVAALSAIAVSYFSSGLVRKVFGWAGGGLVVYLGSLAIVAVLASPTQVFDTSDVSFERAQTVVSIFWGAIGFALLVEGLRRRVPTLRSAGFVLLGLALAKAFLFDLSSLTAFARALSFLGLGALLLVAAAVHQRLSHPSDEPVR